tara:strand:+ start:672 stop:956 length:285 start_codon:yes stop_codon:yes gene_type:complete
MQLIKIKFLGPTNFRGSRYKATLKDGEYYQYSATVPSTYATDNSDALAAAEAVAEKVRADLFVDGDLKRITHRVEIVGSYDGDLFATMTPIYND